MKLSKQALKDIRTFARERIGGFGMWIETGEKTSYEGEVKKDENGKPDWSGVINIDNFNMLIHNRNTQDLRDFINWEDTKKENFTLVNGYCWLDFYVHDRDELRGNVHALINAEGNVVKLWETWANENEIGEIVGMTLTTIHP